MSDQGNSPPPDRVLLAAARQLENIAHQAPVVRGTLIYRRDTVDGWVGGTENPKVSHTAELTPTEAAAQERLYWDTALTEYDAGTAELTAAVAAHARKGDQLLGRRAVPKAPRCDSTGREGAIAWANYDCHDNATRGPLCGRCAMAEHRWRREHNLPPRRSESAA